MTRPLKELLHILLDEVERNGCPFGLCCVNFALWKVKFNQSEYFSVRYFLRSFLISDNIWLFPKGETEPRIEFLKNEIEKL